MYIIGVIVVIIMLLCLYYYVKNGKLENFIVFMDDIIIPKKCWDYLLFNGEYYYLYNSNMLIDNINNPKRFKTKDEAIELMKNNMCPINIPEINLNNKKKEDDPSISLQRECNKHIAPYNFDLDICNTYNNTIQSSLINKIKNIESNNKIYSNYDLEQCMINKITEDNPELEDTHFINNFKDYFNRLNNHINEELLYITH